MPPSPIWIPYPPPPPPVRAAPPPPHGLAAFARAVAVQLTAMTVAVLFLGLALALHGLGRPSPPVKASTPSRPYADASCPNAVYTQSGRTCHSTVYGRYSKAYARQSALDYMANNPPPAGQRWAQVIDPNGDEYWEQEDDPDYTPPEPPPPEVTPEPTQEPAVQFSQAEPPPPAAPEPAPKAAPRRSRSAVQVSPIPVATPVPLPPSTVELSVDGVRLRLTLETVAALAPDPPPARVERIVEHEGNGCVRVRTRPQGESLWVEWPRQCR